MIIAAIAEEKLKGTTALQRIDQTLSKWDTDYPRYNELVSSSVWADHIKCKVKSDYCPLTAPLFDGLELFNNDHYIDVDIARAENISVFVNRPGNALYLLNQALRTLVAQDVNGAGEFREDDPDNDDRLLARLNVHEAVSGNEAQGGRSPFTNNLMLRLFVHIFGDIHQPLHVMSRRSACFPNGDRGGNMVPVIIRPAGKKTSSGKGAADEGTPQPVKTNLHALWDSAAFLLDGTYPTTYTVEQARSDARQLLNNCEQPSTGGRFPGRPRSNGCPTVKSAASPVVEMKNIKNVIIDSIAMHEVIYSEMDKRTGCVSEHSPYHPSAAYLQNVQSRAKEQLITAGTELASYLLLFASALEQAKDLPAATRRSRLPSLIVPCLAGTIFMGGAVVYVSARQKPFALDVRERALLSST